MYCTCIIEQGPEFHSKCEGKSDTLTILRNDLNYVFGGFTSAKWTSNGLYSADSNAFIFSLRRDGISNCQKFKITNGECAIYGIDGPTFGSGHDIHIVDRSDINIGSYTNIGSSYQLPPGHKSTNEHTKKYLSGNFNTWLTTDIEVYQLSNLESDAKS